LGLRPIDIVSVIGKTQDHQQAQQTSQRQHVAQQQQLAVQQVAREELGHTQVSEVPTEDRLELQTEREGAGYGGEYGADTPDEANGEDDEDAAPGGTNSHIDFFA